MSLGKADISKNITSKALMNLETANSFLDSFLNIIKSKSLTNEVKISCFGSFNYKKTPARIGRNPTSMKEYPIPSRMKLNFNTSNKIRNLFN